MKKLSTAVLICLLAPTVQAGDWKYSIAPYLWLPTISVDSSNVNRDGLLPDLPEGTGVSVGPTDYLSSLNFALMLAGDMRNDEWVLMGDMIYLDFGVDDKDIDFARPGVGPLAGSYSADLAATIYSLAGGKTLVKSDNYYLDALIGWRRIGMDFQMHETTRGDIVDTDLYFNDGFVAVNGRYTFSNPKWSLDYYTDLGTGESDFTWQALLGVNYQFNWGKLFANYRHLDYDFGNAKNFSDLTMTFSGPTIGARFEF